jgi:hypothetical protein
MKFSDLREGDVVYLIYYNTYEEPMQLYTWLRSKKDSYFKATDLWADLGDRYLSDDWQFSESAEYESIDVIFNVPSPDPLKMLQELHPELFI